MLPATFLSALTVATYAYDAGFRGGSLNTIVAIAKAESAWNTSATGHDSNGSYDRGLVQINSRAWASISNACAYSGACAMRAAWLISRHGSDFQPWTSFDNGSYRSDLANYAALVNRRSAVAPKATKDADGDYDGDGGGASVASVHAYRIRAGDTLWALSRRYGVSVASLAGANGIANPNLIYAGRWLNIP